MRGGPLRLLHVVNVLGLAGLEYGVIKLVNRLDRTRFQPLICSLTGSSDAARRFLAADVPVVELHRRPGLDASVVSRLASLIRRERVDVVHSHNWATLLYTVVASVLARRPVVIHGEHGREASSAIWKHRVASRQLVRAAAHVTCVSEDLASELARVWGVPLERLSAVANGVEIERFDVAGERAAVRRELGIGEADAVVIGIGRLMPVKDFPTLLRGVSRVRSGDRSLKLVLVGSDLGTDGAQNIRLLADELGLANSLCLLGERRDVPSLLAASDIFVNSSIYEGMSNTILEAMAARRPVIATRVGGTPQIVEDGRTGFLVPPRDPDAIAERLGQLLADPRLRVRLGDAGRERIERRHSMAAMVGGYAEIYRECYWRERVAPQHLSSESRRARWARVARRCGLGAVAWRLASAKLSLLRFGTVLPVPDALSAENASVVVARDHFDRQMARLSRRYTVLPLSNAVRRLADGTLPVHAVSVVIEAPLRNAYRHAWPILRKHGIPATCFIDPGELAAGRDESAEELLEMAGGGVETGLRDAGAGTASVAEGGRRWAEFEARLTETRERAKLPVMALLDDRGATEDDAIRLAALGVEAIVTRRSGRNDPGSDPLALRTIDVSRLRAPARRFDPAALDAALGGWFGAVEEG